MAPALAPGEIVLYSKETGIGCVHCNEEEPDIYFAHSDLSSGLAELLAELETNRRTALLLMGFESLRSG